MKTELSPEALELGRIAGTALGRAGGVDLARAAQAGGDVTAARQVFDRIGVWDLRPADSADDGEAAAAVCRAAGRVAAPVPVAERLAAAPEDGVDALAVVGDVARVNLVATSSDLRWWVIDGSGRRAPVIEIRPMLGTKLGPLVSPVRVGEWVDDPGALPLALTLPCWTLLGAMDTAIQDTRRHLLDRTQFGRPLADNQALQFRLADTVSMYQGFEELAKYTLWSVLTRQPGALVDALGLRLSALETAEEVFRTGHQMHGAMGFCDEVDLSWLSRHLQPVRRLPWGSSETRARLFGAMTELPFAGLFGQGLVGDTVGEVAADLR